jgi:lipopolysaccharide assembly protein A
MVPLFFARPSGCCRSGSVILPMRYISWALRILLFVLFFGFVLKNTGPAVVRFYLGASWEAPMALILLAAFAAGAVAGVTAWALYFHRQRQEILKLRKDIRARPAGSDVLG